MQSVNFYYCKGLTGTAELGMGDGHILFNTFLRSSRTRFLIPHFLLFPLFAFPSAGDIDKIVFPEGMQSVNFQSCKGLTGMADLGYE